jgi:hypothetical protein
MKLFLYKLIFPNCNQLYVGIASSDLRYCSKPNSKFTSKHHHNRFVNKLLKNDEFCYWHVVKEFDDYEKLFEAEQSYLMKVWQSGDFNDRPNWLLNCTNQNSGRASGWRHSEEAKKRIGAANYSIRNYQTTKTLEQRSAKTGVDFEALHNEIEVAMNATNSYHWGGAKIARKFGVSRRTVAKISASIRKNAKSERHLRR